MPVGGLHREGPLAGFCMATYGLSFLAFRHFGIGCLGPVHVCVCIRRRPEA
jgi:hypothetical protein